MRDKVSIFSYESRFFMVAQKTSASSTHEASNFSAYSNATLFFFVISVEEKAYEKVGNVFTFQIYKFVKDILHIWHVSTTTVTYNF